MFPCSTSVRVLTVADVDGCCKGAILTEWTSLVLASLTTGTSEPVQHASHCHLPWAVASLSELSKSQTNGAFTAPRGSSTEKLHT